MTSSGSEPGKAPKRRVVFALAVGLLMLGAVLVVAFIPTDKGIPPPPPYERFELPLIAVERVRFCPNESVGGPCYGSGSQVEVSDLDSDGEVEIVAAGVAPMGEVVTVWHFSAGNLSLEATAFNSSVVVRGLCLVDLGGDARKEIVTGGWGSAPNRWGAYLAVWGWDGTGLTRHAYARWTWNNEDTYLESLACADFDGDGRTDIVAAGFAEPRSGPYVGRVGWISVWNVTSDLSALQRAAETDLWSTQGDVVPHAAAILGASIFVAGLTTDYANDTVGGLLGIFAFDGTAVVTLDTQVISDAYYFVASKAEPAGPGAFRLVVGGYDGSQKTIVETVTVTGSAIGVVGPRTDYRVPTHPGNFTGFTGLATEGDLAVVSGWVERLPYYAFIQTLDGSSGRWEPGPLSEWLYRIDPWEAVSWVYDVTIADVETGGRPEIVSVGQMRNDLELRVWRLPA